MQATQFNIYDKNNASESIVTSVDSGVESPLFSTPSITQSRKRLAQFKKETNTTRVKVVTYVGVPFGGELKSLAVGNEGVAAFVAANTPKPRFSVPDRFNMMAQLTDLLVTGRQKAMLIVGNGGSGKTYTVTSKIESHGFVGVNASICEESDEESDEVSHNDKEYLKVTGATSPMGLYKILFENRTSLIVFDDCDSVFSNTNSVNILKAVLDTSGDGSVSWASPAIERAGMPTSFKFTGKVIFISNKKVNQIPQPLLSRSLIVDMDMTPQDIIDRARMLGTHLTPNLSSEKRERLIDFVEANLSSFRDVSLRLFVLASPFLEADLPNWEDLTIFTG